MTAVLLAAFASEWPEAVQVCAFILAVAWVVGKLLD